MIEAERALLGALLLNPEKMDVVINLVNTNDFSNPKHRYIFETMKQLKMQNREIDYVTVSSVLDNNLYKIGGTDYLIELGGVEASPAIEYLETYIDLIKENSLKRDFLGFIKQQQTALSKSKNIHNFFQAVKDQVESFMQKTKSPFISTKTLIPDIRQSILNDDNPNQFIGIKTGFKNLDELISGFKPNQLIILGARTAMGKTAFMLNLACNIAKNFTSNNKNQKAVIFSLEMAAEELGIRLLSSASQIPLKQLQHKNLTKNEKLQLFIADDKITQLNILIDDDRNNKMKDIETKCRQMKYAKGLDIVFIDYLHLLRKEQNVNIYQEISEISRKLKNLASELNIPIVALSQLSRDLEKRVDKRPVLSDLSNSGSIEQDADVVMLLHRESYYQKDDNNPHTNLIIAKNRSGQLGECSFNFYKQIQRFEQKE
ncbi:replicative DNA helicase [Candidatus Phytoplasma australiense]|uniref:Replicative DNA helicase n=1 Tax=Strawberry lethal yellows phytoplasma (CPA) str. NZSb11 TaxID=980422 RepID=R4RMG5_PHYAS|nr:replicative DNA helicase [Candidatus Phytoplasma australiense]AGL90091.1 Replicative DNA helicase [Strawberry lethal yellows phytoplasma (CPA) str. NZSb11]AGL90495.1 Replicative DNA helicase [Strawberry lethal yellows phytoplasma (CPA) str. NZSb11]